MEKSEMQLEWEQSKECKWITLCEERWKLENDLYNNEKLFSSEKYKSLNPMMKHMIQNNVLQMHKEVANRKTGNIQSIDYIIYHPDTINQYKNTQNDNSE